VGPHDLARRGGGRGHHDGHLAEPEQHERAVAPGQVPHGAVRERAGEVVQVADDGERPRARREPERPRPAAWRSCALFGEEEQDGGGEEGREKQ
jgi:hypothetical protein